MVFPGKTRAAMRRRSDSVAVLAAAAASLAARSAAAQCAMCGTAIQGSEDPLANGIFWSVLFLISLPYAIVGSFVVGLVWAYRRAKLRRERAPLRAVGGRFGLVTGDKETVQ
jgi:hypothetical protein